MLYHNLPIVYYKIVVNTPPLPSGPVEVLGIRILVYERIAIVGIVNDVVTASEQINRRNIWLGIVWNPTFFYSREKVPLQES